MEATIAMEQTTTSLGVWRLTGLSQMVTVVGQPPCTPRRDQAAMDALHGVAEPATITTGAPHFTCELNMARTEVGLPFAMDRLSMLGPCHPLLEEVIGQLSSRRTKKKER